jgi:hypothetical protein
VTYINPFGADENIDFEMELDMRSLISKLLANPYFKQQIVDMVRKDLLKNARYYGNIFGTYAQKTH